MKSIMRKFIVFLLVVMCSSCGAAYKGCGTVKKVNKPEAQYRIVYSATGKAYKLPNGNYFYPVTIKGNDNKNHKVYVSYFTWKDAKPGSKICTE